MQENKKLESKWQEIKIVRKLEEGECELCIECHSSITGTSPSLSLSFLDLKREMKNTKEN